MRVSQHGGGGGASRVVRAKKKKSTDESSSKIGSSSSGRSSRSRADLLWMAAMSLIFVQLLCLVTTSSMMKAATAPSCFFAMAATTTTVGPADQVVLDDDHFPLLTTDLSSLSGTRMDVNGGGATITDNNNNIRLGVTIRNKDILNNAPSCLHSISRVELLNQQNTDIQILSIQVDQEETYRIWAVDDPQVLRAFGGDMLKMTGTSGKIHLLVEDYMPQQLHVTHFSAAPDPEEKITDGGLRHGGSLILGPGQVAIVPLTFLPRFPTTEQLQDQIAEASGTPVGQTVDGSTTTTTTTATTGTSSTRTSTKRLFSSNADDSTGSSSSSSASKVLSIWQQADREEWIGSVSLRSNRVPITAAGSPPTAEASSSNESDKKRVEEYHISTTLLIQTDEGLVTLPIQASALRDNPFGLPDTIYFNVTDTGRGKSKQQKQQQHVNFQSSSSTPPSASAYTEPYISENGIRIMDRFWNHPQPQPTSIDSSSSSSTLLPPGSMSMESPRRARAAAAARNQHDAVVPSSDCFDLYLTHPQTHQYLAMQDMRVYEVLVSQPDITFLQVLPEKDPFVPLVKSPPLQAIREWASWQKAPPRTTTSSRSKRTSSSSSNGKDDGDKADKESSDDTSSDGDGGKYSEYWQRKDVRRDGALYIPADNRQHYLVTICTTDTGVPLDRRAERYLDSKAQWIDPGDEETSLGFVQIRTDTQTLFVALEREVDPLTADSSLVTTTGTTPQKTNAKIGKIAPSSTSSSPSSSPTSKTLKIGKLTTAKEKTESGNDGDSVDDKTDDDCVNGTSTTTGEPCSDSSDDKDHPPKQQRSTKSEAVLQTIPESLEMYLLTSNSNSPITQTSGNISIANVGGENITLMAASIAFHQLEAVKIEEYGLGVKIFPSSSHGCHVIPAFSPPCEDAFSVQVTVNWSQIKELGVTSFEINGKVVVQGSLEYSTVDEWMYAVSTLDLMADSQVVVEIPLTILLVDGNIGLAIQGTTHPFPHFWHVQKSTRAQPQKPKQRKQRQSAATATSSSVLTIGETSSERVTAAFFPLFSSDVRALLQLQPNGEHEGVYEMKSMDHHLRAFSSSMEIPQLTIDTVEVIPATAVADESNHTTFTTTMTTTKPTSTSVNAVVNDESLCSRFKVSLAPNASSSGSEHDSGSSSGDKSSINFADLGLVYLRYMFPPTSLTGKEAQPQSSKAVGIFPTECSLRMTTSPPTGVHVTPLFVYPGKVDVSANEFDSESIEQTTTTPGTAFEEEHKASRHPSIVGFDKILNWFQNSKGGSALRSILEAGNNRNPDERDRILLGRYLYSLGQQALDLESSNLRPVLLKGGAIAPDEKEVLPLYITNHNPVPLKINIDVGEVEGMSIALGRDPVDEGESLLDNLPPKQQFQPQHQRKQPSSKGGESDKSHVKVSEPLVPSGPRAGQPVNGLRRFLLTSDLAMSFFSRFHFRDGVWMSEDAAGSSPMLKKLFTANTFAQYHTTELSSRFTNSTSNACGVVGEHPPPYGSFKKAIAGRRMPGPVLLSTDSESLSELAVCWDKGFAQKKNESETFETVLPPGGVARFDITLRSPPTSVLERDITQFLASGLVLSTSHGEVMPILILFDAPQGKLEISPFLGYYGTETRSPSGARAIRVPAGLFGEPSPEVETTLSIPPRLSRTLDDLEGVDIMPYSANIAENGVSLFMRSSFNRDIQLLKVTSCNPWFEVVLRNQTSPLVSDPLLGVNIGTVSSIVSCAEPDKNMSASLYPSFYRCALNWVTERAELQHQGCGSRATVDAQFADMDGRKAHERSHHESAAKALNRALHVSAWSLGNGSKSGRSSSQLTSSSRRKYDGVLAPVVVDVVANVWDIWRLSAESSLRRLSTNLRAVIKYNTTGDGQNRMHAVSEVPDSESQLLSVAMKDLTVESVLETPQLLDTDRVTATLQRDGDDDDLPVVDFPRTYVSSVSSISIPLKNPTAVPVRVRLAALPEEDEELHTSSYDLESEVGADEVARTRFLKGLAVPYVQNGRRAHTNPGLVRQQWWDGSGSFFLSDFNGGLIRSHYNITVRAGSGALVSLLNPSLLSNNAFLAGCGSRCGVRDDVIKNDVFYDLRRTSPIGASSATGSILMGRNRAASADTNRLMANTRNLKVFAGGSMLSGGFGPAPFAVPFPALGEIIIPPFGTAEVGPIYFRPPGRHSSVGCESVENTMTSKHCDESEFLGLVFLENSLTGLERVALRGRTEWERVIFRDPPNSGDGDDFSDIELRNGRPALIFPGSLYRLGDGSPIVKEVLVKNEGDTTVMFGEIYLSDTSKLHTKKAPDRSASSCTFGDFVLLNCSTSSEGDFAPLRLLPGQSGSLLIEHRPRCAKLTDFVALNLEYLRENDGHPPIGSDRTERLQNAANSWKKKSFRKQKEELLLGYEMSKRDLALCRPYNSNKHRRWAKGGSTLPLKRSYMYGAHYGSKDESHNGAFGMLTFLAAASLFGGASIVVANYFQLRLHSAHTFRAKVRGLRKNKQQQPRRSDSNWRAAFRFLARVDPTSADLQTLGREQIRMVVLSRFRSMGIMAPQCFNSAGAMQRERSLHTGRSAVGKDGGTGGNEKIRTLSDAIFQRFRTKTGCEEGILPCELGWRTASVRGILNESSLDNSLLQFKTQALLLRRSEQSSYAGEESVETDVDGPSIGDGRESVSRASTYEDHSGDDDSDASVERSFVEKFGNRKNGHGSVMLGSTPIPALQSSEALSPPDSSQYTTVASRSTKGGRKSHGSRSSRKAVATVNANATSNTGIPSRGSDPVTPQKSKAHIGRKANKAGTISPVGSKVSRQGGKGPGITETTWTRKESKQGGSSRSNRSAMGVPFSLADEDKSSFDSPITSAQAVKPPLRPPPGLAPPPGFDQSPIPATMLAPASPASVSKAVSAFPSLPETQLPGQSQTGLPVVGLASIIQGDQLQLSSPISPMPPRSGVQPPDHAQLLDLVLGESAERAHQRQNSFDVMDFLDGILNEGSTAADDDGGPSGLLAETPAAAPGVDGDGSNPNLLPIPSNPWASGSRATAYGISFENEQAADIEPVGPDLPLLTPAAILAEESVVEEGDDKYWGKSFYTNLLQQQGETQEQDQTQE